MDAKNNLIKKKKKTNAKAMIIYYSNKLLKNSLFKLQLNNIGRILKNTFFSLFKFAFSIQL